MGHADSGARKIRLVKAATTLLGVQPFDIL